IIAGTAVAAGTTVTAGAASFLLLSGRSKIGSSVDGALEFNNNAASTRSTAQFNVPQITKTANYQAVALDSGLYFNNIGAVAAVTNWLPASVAGMHFSFDVDAAQI